MSKVVPFERSVEYLTARAALGRREGRLLDALSLFRRAAEREPHNLKHRMDMAETLCEMGCYTESNRVLAAMLPEKSAPDDCYFGLCCNYFGMSEPEKAYRAMVQFLARDPKAMEREEVRTMFKNLTLLRALSESKNRRVVRATRLLTEANERLKRGDLGAAELLSRRALKANARRQDAGVLLARALMGQGRSAEARDAIERALSSGRARIRTLFTAVEVYLAAGDRAAARQAFARMKIDPADADERRLLLEAACALGDDDKVRPLLPKALRAAPYDRSLLHLCAVNRVREGREILQAVSFWTRMLLIDPSDPVARHYLRKAESGQLSPEMGYGYALPDEERARRLHALKQAQVMSDEQLREDWQARAFRGLLTWAVRSGERQGALLAQALLSRIDASDARALLFEGMLDPGAGVPNATISWPERGGEVVMTISGGSGMRVPIVLRKAMKLAIGRAKPLTGELSTVVVRLALERFEQLRRPLRPRDAEGWAAALLASAMGETGREMHPAAAAALLDCPARRAERCARLLGLAEKEDAHADHRL